MMILSSWWFTIKPIQRTMKCGLKSLVDFELINFENFKLRWSFVMFIHINIQRLKSLSRHDQLVMDISVQIVIDYVSQHLQIDPSAFRLVNRTCVVRHVIVEEFVRTVNAFVRTEVIQVMIAACVVWITKLMLAAFILALTHNRLVCVTYPNQIFIKLLTYVQWWIEIKEKPVNKDKLTLFFITPSQCICIILEVPCDRSITPLNEEKCSRTLFLEPPCDESSYRLIYHRSTKTCLCRENNQKLLNCFNNGLLLIDDDTNSSICS